MLGLRLEFNNQLKKITAFTYHTVTLSINVTSKNRASGAL